MVKLHYCWQLDLYVVRLSILATLLAAGAAGPAAAVDCFPKVAAVGAHAPPRLRAVAHHRTAGASPGVHHVRHIAPRGRRAPSRKVMASASPKRPFAESSRDQQTIPISVPRPLSCDDQPPAVLQTLAPRRPVAPAQLLLAALTGPVVSTAARAAASPLEASEITAPSMRVEGLSEALAPFIDAPGSIGASSGQFAPPPTDAPAILAPPALSGGPSQSALPLSSPPSTSPQGPTPIGAQITPPPTTGPKLVIFPSVAPLLASPQVSPSTLPFALVGPQSQPPSDPSTPASGVVPEPATWVMLMLGLAGVGSGLRHQRAARSRRHSEALI